MCGFCAVFAGLPHWTDGASDAAQGVELDDRERRLARRHRVSLINVVVAHFGCAVEDWGGGEYIVRSQRGRSELVASLPQVWQVVENIAGRPVDPLLPGLLDALTAPPDA